MPWYGWDCFLFFILVSPKELHRKSGDDRSTGIFFYCYGSCVMKRKLSTACRNISLFRPLLHAMLEKKFLFRSFYLSSFVRFACLPAFLGVKSDSSWRGRCLCVSGDDRPALKLSVEEQP